MLAQLANLAARVAAKLDHQYRRLVEKNLPEQFAAVKKAAAGAASYPFANGEAGRLRNTTFTSLRGLPRELRMDQTSSTLTSAGVELQIQSRCPDPDLCVVPAQP